MQPGKLASLVLAGSLGLSACVDQPTGPQAAPPAASPPSGAR